MIYILSLPYSLLFYIYLLYLFYILYYFIFIFLKNYLPMNKDTYYPSLFKKQKKQILNENDKFTYPCSIPLNTYYEDDRYNVVNKVEKEYITVFGFSSENTEKIVELIKTKGSIKNMEYGRNYVNVTFEDVNDYEDVISMNRTMVEGEYIGVFRNNMVSRGNIKKKEKGLISKMLEYLFG
ncbi:hypothetical protein SLOPH_2106 [Spraguea lophii 42_110]|uniref:RRM Nup35-type domain-containing protein n=1 Tax=Spraguea lophii (strain 42_110) TaxID=1358809 RepID=S7WAJ8_SPRLO|nr:hypothetical protein SLOPH_2106 [Spraguea lophii 42_110]